MTPTPLSQAARYPNPPAEPTPTNYANAGTDWATARASYPLNPPLADQPALAQRRASVRFYSRQAISAAVNKRWNVRVRDVSATGIGLICGQSIGVNLVGEVELHLPDQSDSLSLPIRVAHVTDLRNGTWLVGCAFGRLLREDELSALR